VSVIEPAVWVESAANWVIVPQTDANVWGREDAFAARVGAGDVDGTTVEPGLALALTVLDAGVKDVDCAVQLNAVLKSATSASRAGQNTNTV
jgi:hypothetical protein